MTKTLTRQERLERKQELAAEIRKQGDAYYERREGDGEAWPDGTKDAWDKVNADYDDNEQQLIRMTNDEAVQGRLEQIRADEEQSQRRGLRPGLDDRVPGSDESFGDQGHTRDSAQEYTTRQRDKRLAFRSWLLGGASDLVTDEMREACERVGTPRGKEIHVGLMPTERYRHFQRSVRYMGHQERELALENGEHRALSSLTAGDGPELVPQTFVNMLEMAILSYGDMLAYFDTITTNAGETMNWPTVDDTSNEGDWVDAEHEDTQTVGEPNPDFTRPTWDAHQLHSKWIKVPLTLNEDSMFDVEMLIATLIGERLGRTINTAATTGDGVKKAKGILTDAPVGATTALGNAISYDDLVNLEHSIDPAVRSQSAYCLHDSIIQALRLLKDGDGRPLWQQSMRDGQPDRINNRPYAYNQAMTSTLATGNHAVLFGRLSDYKLRRVKNVRIIRAAERFIELLQLGFLGYIRVDGKLLRVAADARCTVKKLEQG